MDTKKIIEKVVEEEVNYGLRLFKATEFQKIKDMNVLDFFKGFTLSDSIEEIEDTLADWEMPCCFEKVDNIYSRPHIDDLLEEECEVYVTGHEPKFVLIVILVILSDGHYWWTFGNNIEFLL